MNGEFFRLKWMLDKLQLAAFHVGDKTKSYFLLETIIMMMIGTIKGPVIGANVEENSKNICTWKKSNVNYLYVISKITIVKKNKIKYDGLLTL